MFLLADASVPIYFSRNRMIQLNMDKAWIFSSGRKFFRNSLASKAWMVNNSVIAIYDTLHITHDHDLLESTPMIKWSLIFLPLESGLGLSLTLTNGTWMKKHCRTPKPRSLRGSYHYPLLETLCYCQST